MSLTKAIMMLSFACLCGPVTASAQLFTDQGMMSGSGLSLLPTATTAPASEMQVQATRMSFLSTSPERANIVGLTFGLSTSLEGYFRITSQEIQTSTSEISYGFGGKFKIPGTVPILHRLALWGESTISDMGEQSIPTIFPAQANRGGITASLDSNGFHPTLFFGGIQLDHIVTPMAGAGFTLALGHSAQAGLEAMWGYLEQGSMQAAFSGSVRLYSNISLHIIPGYLTTTAAKGWMISAGISFSSTDIDYHQVRGDDNDKDKFLLPSIDELEHQSTEGKKE